MEPRKEEKQDRFQIEQLEERIAPTARGSRATKASPATKADTNRGS